MPSLLPVAVDADATDDFRAHLAHINELISETNLSEWIIENVFSCATKLVTLLVEESLILQNSCGLASPHERFNSGPLTTILVEDRFFDKLLVWVEGRPCVDSDVNARLLDHQRTRLLLLFESLITQSHQHLLHVTILRPLEQFVYKLSSNLRPPYESTYARTLYELCVLLCRDASLLSRFRELPFKGNVVTAQIQSRLNTAIRRTFNAAKLCPIWATKKLPMRLIKPTQPVSATTHCIYQSVCSCGSSYVGRTDRCLSTWIGDHIPMQIAGLMAQQATGQGAAGKLPA